MFKALSSLAGHRDVSKRRVYYDAPAETRLDVAYYAAIAERLNVRPSLVRAIAVIETAEKGLTDRGYPVVRLEAAYWRNYRLGTRAAQGFDKAKNSRDLNTRWGQFNEMAKADREAAILCHSFGWAQIMGFNHRTAGYERADNFLRAMMTLEGQAEAFIGFCQGSPLLLDAMRREDIGTIALHYNGPAYRRNDYDKKLVGLLDAGGGNAWA